MIAKQSYRPDNEWSLKTGLPDMGAKLYTGYVFVDVIVFSHKSKHGKTYTEALQGYMLYWISLKR